MTDGIEIVDNETKHRYEVTLDGELAGFAMYRKEPGRTVFTHTVVLPAFEGKGLGSRLARVALDDTVERGDLIVPICPFIAAYLTRHDEYAASVAPVGA